VVALQSEEFGDIEITRGPHAEASPGQGATAPESSAWALDAANTQTA
jgi:hypothetical protein